jgi:copper(I)-binding protein
MNITASVSTVAAFLALISLSPGAFAHVSISESRAQVGANYQGILSVGHGCDASPTTGLTVRLPPGFSSARGLPKAGWTVSAAPGEITWTAAPGAAVPTREKGEFVLTGKLPDKPSALWFKVLQQCEQGSIDWAQLPANGTSTDGMKSPAVLLQVLSGPDLAAYRALPQVDGGWVRASVPGQQATGAFMRITAKETMQLIGVDSPAAGVADVHEMKMQDNVMRMRAMERLELPAGTPVELKPGGYHLMLQDLKQPLTAGTTVPVTLLLRNAAGAESKLQLKLPVLAQPPGGAAALPAGDHKH